MSRATGGGYVSSRERNAVIDIAAQRALVGLGRPSADDIITEYLGGMPATTRLDELKRRRHEQTFKAQRDEHNRWREELRRRFPRWQTEKGKEPHDDHHRYMELLERAGIALAAQTGAEVLREERELVAVSAIEMREWHAMMAHVSARIGTLTAARQEQRRRQRAAKHSARE